MDRLQDNELLSAYLDGELTAAEKAEVDRRLAEDPAARQLLEELRVVSSAVRGLPAQSLDEDLSGAVLRAAQYQMLNGPAEADADLQPRTWRTVFRRALRPRRLLWSAVAVAAAVMIMLWHPDQANHVAKQPQQNPEVASHPRAGEIPQIGPAPGEKSAAAPEGSVVVRCDLVANAAQQKAFQRVLAEQGISAAAVEVTNDPASPIARFAEGPAGDQMKVSGAAKPVYLRTEMSAAQYDAAMAELKAHPELFPACKVEERSGAQPAPSGGKRQVVFVLRVVP